MNIKKKFAAVMAAVCLVNIAATIPEQVSAENTYGNMTYEKMDSDGDGISDYIEITKCTETATEAVIPETIEGLPVKKIGERAFISCKQLEKVTFPETLEVIGPSAFSFCESLKELNFPQSLAVIDFNSFSYCYSLTEVNITENIYYIGNAVFRDCDGITEFYIPENVTTLGSNILMDIDNLKTVTVDENNEYFCSVDNVLYTKDMKRLISYSMGKTDVSFDIPDTVTTIGRKSFYKAPLKKVNFPEGVTIIEDNAFSQSKITELKLPDSLTLIDFAAFAGCRELVGEVIIPENVTAIGQQAFGSCEKLEYVKIPEATSTMMPYMFIGCSSLREVEVDENNVSVCDVDGVYFNKKVTNLMMYPPHKTDKFYVVPETVSMIDISAICNCAYLETLVIPENVTQISKNAIEDSESIETVLIENPDCSIFDAETTIAANAMICAYDGSTGHSYAEKYGREFWYMAYGTLSGDINENYVLNLYDAVEIAKGNMGMREFTDYELTLCDCTADGVVNLYDIIKIAKYMMT